VVVVLKELRNVGGGQQGKEKKEKEKKKEGQETKGDDEVKMTRGEFY
jgi:hypothetical protein